jgi:hypothetical protein
MTSKTLLEYGFSESQLRKIFEFLQYVHLHTTDAITDRIEGIRYFVDKQNNFYASYCLIKITDIETNETSLKYIMIDEDGLEHDLNLLYDNSADIIKRLNTYFEIEIV